MPNYDIYVFILCFIVFSLFTVVFSYMIATMLKMKLRLIRSGLEDREIKREYRKRLAEKRVWTILDRVVSILLCLVLGTAFVFSVYLNLSEDRPANGIPSLRVVKSGSMAEKYEENDYLFENGLDDQIQTFDLIITRHLPPEDELKLYDIVVYRQDDLHVIHRIVGIEEPNENHPTERHFLLQGDAVDSPDRFPVLYSQMQGIYRGERIPFVGSFIMFLQSPAGWLCILLVLAATIASPIIEKKIRREEEIRLTAMDKMTEEYSRIEKAASIR